MTFSQRQLFKVAMLTFSQLTDIPSFIPHECHKLAFQLSVIMLNALMLAYLSDQSTPKAVLRM
jgi:hypothetical protein